MRTYFETAWLSCALSLLGCGEDETFFPLSNGNTTGAGGVASSGTGSAAGGAGGEGNSASQPPDAGVADPVLAGLVVDGAAVGLKPNFDPETGRYSVLAHEDYETLVVNVSAAPEFEIEIDGHEVESGTPVELNDVEPGAEFEVRVENSEGDHREYTVLYLPYDFPDIRVGIDEPGASTDPIYVAPRGSGRRYLAKLNNHGVPLFYQKQERNTSDFKKHPNGQYSYGLEREEEGRWEHIVLDENFDEVTRVRTVDLLDTDSHEFHILPNGNFIVLAYERAVRDLTEFGRGSQTVVVDAILQELSPEREVLFQWNSWDHMPYDETVYHKSEADYSHINSVFVDQDGNWILSSRGMAQVLKIDRATGEVLWRLGGVSNEFDFIDDPFEGLCGQHTATRVENGNLLLFDNGQSCYPEMPERGDLTRVVEYEIDEEKKTAKLVFSFDREGAYTVSQGSSQRLANGNTFIGWGLGYSQLATEVDPEGNIVFEFGGQMLGNWANSYRAYRFAD